MKTFQIHIALKFMTGLTTEQSSMEMTTQDGSQNDDKIHVCIGHGRTCLFNPYHRQNGSQNDDKIHVCIGHG